MNNDPLPDILVPSLRIVFCGTAAGRRSAEVGAYYAGPGNRFWPALAEVGLTPRRMSPAEFRELPKYGIGLTDLAKKACGMDSDIRNEDFDVEGFTERLANVAPRIVAFNGKQAASRFLGVKGREIAIGPQSRRIGSSLVYVLPSTSGAGSRYWDIGPWRDLAMAAAA